jgi:signal transduction histidine kinase/ActR/RegA family two-component response regulator
MNAVPPDIRSLARRLIALEAANASADGPVGAAVRACDKLRVPLARLAGVAGFRSLLGRAVALATAEIPWLDSVRVLADGSMEGFDAAGHKQGGGRADEAGVAIVAELLSEQLRAAVRTRDHFLAVLSHELRNPLTALSTGLQLLQMDGDDPAAAEGYRAMMDRQLKQMVRLVDDLLDISRITTGKLELRKERVDLASVLSDAVEASGPLIDRGGHQLTVSLPAGAVVLDADPTRLGQVFLNLLTNAAKYSEKGGHIRLTVERDGGEVVVSVRDSGIGIPAAHLPHVFEVFVQVDAEWRRAQGGLGIGLSLVKEFVGLHGGRVEAQSDGIGQGSEFVVRLPAGVAPAAVPPVAAAEPARGPPRRILVVDDNRDAVDSLAMMLELMGHEVRTAHDGEAGIAVAAAFRPEVILMDLGMPKLNGYEAAARIRAEPWGAGPFLVALTGWGADDDRRQTHDAGFDRHLVKPVDPAALVKLLAEMPTESV